MQIIRLQNQNLSAEIALQLGNTLFSLQHKNKELLYFPFTLEQYRQSTKLAGNPFMHPWANRLEDDYITLNANHHNFPNAALPKIYRDGNHLPLHGLLLKSDKWKTIAQQPHQHTAQLHFNDALELSVFPFEHRIEMTHELIDENEIRITVTLTNLSNKAMPISFGFHPYFLLPEKRENIQLCIPADFVIETNEKQIPNGKKCAKNVFWNFNEDTLLLGQHTFDHGFFDLKRNEKNEAVFRVNSLEIRFDENFPYAQIYAPLQPEKPYVCIEPMTTITNGLNTNACPYLQMNESYTAVFSIHINEEKQG